MNEHLDPVAVRINSILVNHRPAQGMKVAMGQTCQCGYWTGEERPGVDKPVGNAMSSDGLDWHRAQLIAADHLEALRQARSESYADGLARGKYEHQVDVAQDKLYGRTYEQGQRDVFAFHPEWTVTGMCNPDCLPCRRLDELIEERSKGYEEGRKTTEAPEEGFNW